MGLQWEVRMRAFTTANLDHRFKRRAATLLPVAVFLLKQAVSKTAQAEEPPQECLPRVLQSTPGSSGMTPVDRVP